MKHRRSNIENSDSTVNAAMESKRSSFARFMSRGNSSRQNSKKSNNNVENPIMTTITSFFGNNNDDNNNNNKSNNNNSVKDSPPEEHKDTFNYALLIVLYTLQGIPIGLSASIPFLLQEKIGKMTAAAAAAASAATTAATTTSATSTVAATTAAAVSAEAARLSYNANAIFALCSWPFSLKLLWAPIVDSIFFRQFGRRKSWLIPVQTLAGLIMVLGSDFVEKQLGFTAADAAAATATAASSMNVKGVTIFFFVLYFLMATQDIAVDGWALTMLSKRNRGRGPLCNSIGQNIGYFLSFVGFLALNDVESSETLWRPLLRLPSQPGVGLVSLGSFIRFMGYFMLITTTIVAMFKREIPKPQKQAESEPTILAKISSPFTKKDDDDDDAELDASEIGLKETYHRLWAVCKLPAVQTLFVILFTYRLPTALSDNVKFLKAVEFGMSKSTTALLSPTLILPLGILVPIIAAKVWHGHALKQFLTAFKVRVTLVPILDMLMLYIIRNQHHSQHKTILFWLIVIASTGLQAIVNSLQFNAQMIFFASRVDPAIGGSYMTLLNTASNLGGTWPASFVMWLIGKVTPDCDNTTMDCGMNRDPYFILQILFSGLGLLWIFMLGKRVQQISALPDDAWRTHLLDDDDEKVLQQGDSSNSGDASSKRGNEYFTSSSSSKDNEAVRNQDVESADADLSLWAGKDSSKRE